MTTAAVLSALLVVGIPNLIHAQVIDPGIYALVGVVGAAVIAGYASYRQSAAASSSATAQEVKSLGERLDEQATRLDAVESQNRLLRTYVWDLTRALTLAGEDVPKPPDGMQP